MRIFLLEDDELLFEIIEEFLLEKGYKLKACRDGLEAEEILLHQKFDLLLLDVQVPSLNGFELLKSLRALSDKTPAIFITALDSSKDLKYGFEIGGDDYIKKPFDLDELEARIENIKKHHHLSHSIEISQSLSFECNQCILYDREKQLKIALTQKESAILLFFLSHPNQILSIQEIMSNVWAYEYAPSENTLRSYIKNLRRHLGFEKISNIKGLGYRFNTI